jgi:hypothetical protein
MRAEHRRPLAAFVLVALACALVVGQSLRTATVQGLIDRGLPLTVLIPIAPDMLFTIDASGANGRGGDLPYVGRALVAVSRPAPPSQPATTAVATVPVLSPNVVVRTAPGSAAGGSARAAAAQPAPPQRASTATSGARTRTVAPARSTPALSPGRAKPVPTVVAEPERTDREGPSHQPNRGPHEAADAPHRQSGHQKQPPYGHAYGHQKQNPNQGQKQHQPKGHAYGHQKQPSNGHAYGHQKQNPNQGPKEHEKQQPKQQEKQQPKSDQKGHAQQRH